jgi:two-component system sensor histidine kinase DegS
VIELGLERALEEYVGEFEERHGIAVTFSAPPSVKMPPSVELQLFRIVQEALANVRKHSGASHAEVSITIPSSGVLQLIISDNGCGFDTIREESSRPGSFGLKGMRERAENLGGTSRYESEPGRGTRVIVDVPIRGRSARQYETLAPAAR